MRKVKFIHAADLHLDSPLASLGLIDRDWGQRLQEAVWQAYDNLLDLAVKEEVDFVIFAGDIFDDFNYYFETQRRFIRGLERLSQAGIDSYVLFGNHDFVDGISSRTNNIFALNNERVHIFPNDRVEAFIYEQEGQPLVRLLGRSFWQNHIEENLVPAYGDKLDELKNQANYDASLANIGVLHGQLNASSEQRIYAPFKLTDLEGLDIDYWALGHVHTRQEFVNEAGQTWAIYPGNLCGRHINEKGERGAYLIELSQEAATAAWKLETSFQHLAPFVWREETLNLTAVDAGIASPLDLETYLVDYLDALHQDCGQSLLVRVILSGQTSLAGELIRDKGSLTAIQDGVNESLFGLTNGQIFVIGLVNLTRPQIDFDKLSKDKSLLGIYLQKNRELLDQEVLAENLLQELSAISNNTRARKLARDPAFANLIVPNEDSLRQILQRAEKKAVTVLLDKVGDS